MGKLVIVGASGKLGFATLNAIIDNDLVPTKDIVCTTSSQSGAQKLEAARQRGIEIRSANWDDDVAIWKQALQGCAKLFLISSARVELDYNEAPEGKGREKDHYGVLQAAKDAGIEHVYYTSLAFANPSRSRVMTAHERTEAYLKTSGMKYTIIREGLYNESFFLYFGHSSAEDDRHEIPVAGDSKISWTSIPDLGLANGLVLAAPSEKWSGKTFYLSQSQSWTLDELAGGISKLRGREVKLKVVSRDQHEKYYVEERGMPEPFIKWWSKTYDALRENECEIKDSTLESLLNSKGVKPTSMQDSLAELLAAQ